MQEARNDGANDGRECTVADQRKRYIPRALTFKLECFMEQLLTLGRKFLTLGRKLWGVTHFIQVFCIIVRQT